MTNLKSISIFGDYPPPYGGVSIHIKRVADNLIEKGMLDNVYHLGRLDKTLSNYPEFVKNINISTRYDFVGYIYWLIRYGAKDQSKVLHFHNNENGSFAILIAKYFLKKKIVITLHDQMRLLRKAQWFRVWYITPFLSLLFKQRDIQWIAVNEMIKAQLISKGVSHEMISVIPAYINNINTKTEPLKDEIVLFFKKRTPLMSMYAMSTRLLNDIDLYGIDISLQLVSILKVRYPQIGLIVCIPGNKSELMMDNYKKYIQNNKLEENILFVGENVQDVYGLWTISDVFLRPTCSDGDSLCVREALEVKTVVLASDVAIRPQGTITFENRNINDFVIKAHYILDNLQRLKNSIPINRDPFGDLLHLYNNILNSNFKD